MFVRIYNENPNPREIDKIVTILKSGGIIIYPTDTVYGLGCDIFNTKAVERVAQIKGVRLDKANFSFICHDLSHLSDFANSVDNRTYKLMKQCFPGPFTFVLNASHKVPKLFKSKKKTVGIRIPNNNICRTIVKELGNPIMTTSIRDEDEIIEYTTDPELIYEKYKLIVDAVIDGGTGNNIASTVIDCTQDEIVILRQGAGLVEIY
jgi:tRNA threonylcarbamoyl adenosine modification protein (Sua5/YciO/YrdC/YwlC family)